MLLPPQPRSITTSTASRMCWAGASVCVHPPPYAYSVMIHRTVYGYCFLLPFGLVGTIGRMTPLISVLVAYTFMALEALASELEEPFGVSANDLALEHMSLGIEETMREMIGQPVSNVESLPERFVLFLN